MKLQKEDIVVVVPTRNSDATLRTCLKSIRQQSQPCTLVVVDNGSTDETLSIAHEFADIVLTCGPERSAQRNAGAAATSASVVGFIDSDMELPPTVVSDIVEAFDSGAVSVVVPERTIGEGFWADVRAFERSFYDGSEEIEAPRFFIRDVFDAVCGFDETLTGPEDWDLGIRTRNAGPRARIDSVILHHEGRVRYFSACRKKGYYGPGLGRFVVKHGASGMLGVSRRPWLRQPRALLTPLGVGLLVLKTGEATAVLLAIVRG
ncbi:glycosyltransferase family 2 protein [Ferrimicrobium acidiphilum]|uniref:4,4'-diaponeurosporenoate glycosyltransferase n=1 Tax=Ferrimicrobium acidiphilum DSM 19497 TaxID=1121877 RepID=A0A0D8FRG0_9ACTN|nr:glycosyltransferase [Ferrimicrobium acidiphilum]KJE75559.1 putative glycosyl transferase [Ferrimicrobium acidiphilum DSM 19497]